MSSSRREREYARRRYEKFATKVAEKDRKRRARNRVLAVVGGAAAVVLVVGGVGWLVFGGGNDDATTAAAPTPSASTGASLGSSTNASASSTAGGSAAANPCPKPASGAVENPKSFDKAPDASLAEGKTWTLTLKTSCGDVVATLDGAKAPKAVASTIFLAKNDFWNGSPCHRLTTSGIYVLQCGDPTGKGTGGPGYSYGPVENAPADNVYPAGTIAMARQGGNGTSMGSQFFLVYKDSTIPSDSAGGYTVLGRITSGLDVVQKVADGGVVGGGGDGAPARAISLTSASVSAG